MIHLVYDQACLKRLPLLLGSNDYWNLNFLAMASFFTFIMFLPHAGLVVQAADMQIARETNHPNDDILLQRDTSECPRRGVGHTPDCAKYSAALLGGCWCQCGRPAGKYTFFEPSNTCVKVADARRLSGMVVICLLNNY